MSSESEWDACSVSSSLSSYDDCDASVYSWSSLGYSYPWADSFDLSYCPCCGPPIPKDELFAQHCEKEGDYIGWKFAPYRDFRSAARSRRRKRQDRRMCHSYRCRKEGQAYADTRNTKEKREIKRLATSENQKESISWTSDGRLARYSTLEWDIHQPEELDQDLEYMDDIERYKVFHQHAEIFESTEAYLEVGEDFSTWCQRRINEMRSVKEARIQYNLPATAKPMVWQRKSDGGYLRQYNVYTGDASTTTLPTNAYDALGHMLLRNILTPSRWWRRRRLVRQASLFQPINGFRWFGEYEWEWYRNAAGCWKVGYGGPYNGPPYIFSDECPYCRSEEKNAAEECCCGGTGIKPGPEEVQRCSLVEWVGEEGREIMINEQGRKEGCIDTEHDTLEVDVCDLQIVSDAVSDVVSIRVSEY
ncbi:hypothetical protein IQ06DRAFT_327882 [Phaeosphaeriaceae sp. SRC1lsM3a]|nr:hypothetical protein IQ06DRAFT_327882 [Stagonospora sp. SRC1lsM3a]